MSGTKAFMSNRDDREYVAFQKRPFFTECEALHARIMRERKARIAKREATRILAHVEPQTPVSYSACVVRYGISANQTTTKRGFAALAESLAAFCQMEGF